MILFAIVGIVITSAVMIPIMEDMSERVVTSHNQADTRYKYASFFQEEELENRNGVPYVSGTPLSEISSNVTARVITNDFAMQSIYNTETGTHDPWYIMDTGVDVVGSNLKKVVFEKGEYTVYNTTDAITSEGAYTFVLLPAKNGDYIAGNRPIYVNSDSTLYVFGTGTNGNTIYSGTVTDGLTVVSTSSETTPTATLTTTLIQESSGLYEITNYNTTETYHGIYIPIEYYEITETDETMRSIIGLLPVFIVLIILIATGYGLMSYIRSEKNDI